MSNVISDLREAIQAYLATPFPDPVQIAGGRGEGVNRDPFPKIRVWHPGYTPKPTNQTLAKPTLTLRYFPTLSKQPSVTEPRDQTALEQAEVDLLTAFAGKNRAGDFIDNVAVTVTGCVLNDDPARWYVEMTLTALMQNIAQPAA
jgi:hypothetical protein